jgi:hypothetical protein
MNSSRQNSIESYKTPSSKQLSGQLLFYVCKRAQQSVILVFLLSAPSRCSYIIWIKHSVCQQSGGWSNVHRRPILKMNAWDH